VNHAFPADTHLVTHHTSPSGSHLRILIVDLAERFGGPETRVLSQVRGLQGRVGLCAAAVVRNSPLHARMQGEGLPCEPVSRGRADPRLVFELKQIIRRGGYQLLDAHNIQSIFWGHLAGVMTGVRGRVTTLHSDYVQEYSGVRRWLYPSVLRLMNPITRHVVHVTQPARPLAAGRAATVIENSVEVPDSPPEGKDLALDSEWGWPASAFVVAVVGRLFAVKGHAYLIDAFACLRDRPSIKLLIVGDGPLRAELEARVAAHGLTDRVRFAGFCQDVSRLLLSVDCVCLPSVWELLPYAALEAAACARPIVASAVGGIRDLLHDGETALLVPARDPDALANAIRKLAMHPEEAARIGRAAYDLVRQRFSREEMVRKTIEVYEQALG
jgi:glycosyltransferase involved in cell wall biosynthesis